MVVSEVVSLEILTRNTERDIDGDAGNKMEAFALLYICGRRNYNGYNGYNFSKRQTMEVIIVINVIVQREKRNYNGYNDYNIICFVIPVIAVIVKD